MSNQSKKRRLNPSFLITLAVVLAVVLVGLVLLIGWLGKDKNTEPEDSNKPALIQIETPYATLKYPAQWEKNLHHEGKTENGTYTEVFYCCLSDLKIEIFRVYFGNTDQGSPIGYVMKDGAPVPFSVEGADLREDDSWTETQRVTIYGMADGINTVIEEFLADYGG